MLFNSIDFLVFFAAIVFAYFLFPYKWRNMLLLAGSCFFYMFFKPEYILILGFTIVLDYYLGLSIEKATNKKKKKSLLIVSLVSNFLVLAIFKYYNFINENVSAVLETAGLQNPVPFLKIALPIGLSFHTFQAMSYIIEVYRSKQKAEKNFFNYALYVMFFPQLVAGPIERPQNMLHQFYEKHRPEPKLIIKGLQLILWGFFKKIVIADRLGYFVDIVYNDPYQFGGIYLVIATFFFAFQIYCDFSGYSDIAIGTAAVLGFRLMRNFDRPYLSSSMIDFWRRWHISLSTWLRDYVYIPLVGNHSAGLRNIAGIMIVFVLSGLWHGAKWSFILWGTLNGILVGINHVVNKSLRSASSRFYAIAGTVITFCATSFCWIFFRANTLKDAGYIISNLFSINSTEKIYAQYSEHFNGMGKQFIIAIISIFLLMLFEFNQDRILTSYNSLPAYSKGTCWYLLIIVIILFGHYKANTQFIYFQF